MASRQARFHLAMAVWLAASMLAGAAHAQTLSSTVSSVSVDLTLTAGNVDAANHRYIVNLSDCRDLAQHATDDITFHWTFASTPPTDGQYTIKVQANDETCSESSLAVEGTDQCATYVQQQSLGSSKNLSDRLTFADITGVSSEADCDQRSDFYDVALIFTSFTTGSTTSNTTDFDEVRFELQTVRPAAPTGVTATAGESTIRVDWTAVTNADSYDVFYSTDVLNEGDAPENIVASMQNTTSDKTSLTDNIQRNVTYYIAVATLDADGNESLLSQVVSTTTQPVTDFYELYRQEGGADRGCAVVGSRAGYGWPVGATAIGLGLFALARRARRSRAKR